MRSFHCMLAVGGGALAVVAACSGCRDHSGDPQRDAAIKIDRPSSVDSQPEIAPPESPTPVDPDGIELASNQWGAESIAVDDAFVYWTRQTTADVMKIRKDGSGPPIQIHQNDSGEVKDIAADATAVYWGSGMLYVQAKATGQIKTLSIGTFVGELIPLGGRLYWENTNSNGTLQIDSILPDGTDLQPVGAPQQRGFLFTTDGQLSFLALPDPSNEDSGEIDMVSNDGTSKAVLAKTQYPWQVVVDDEYIYWMEGLHLNGAIKKKRKSGEGDVVSLTDGFQMVSPQSMAADANALYWTQLGVASGAVGKVSKAGGDAKLIALNQVVPQGIAVDDQFVYWVNYGPTVNGTVRKIAK